MRVMAIESWHSYPSIFSLGHKAIAELFLDPVTVEEKVETSPRDIGPLLMEVAVDIEKECKDEILASLWSWAWPHLRRRVAHGLPEWYKERLLEQQFETKQPT